MVGAANLYSDARDLIAYARAHFSPTGNPALDKAFTDVVHDYYPRQTEAANIAWVTDTIGGAEDYLSGGLHRRLFQLYRL
ncbi:Uncharacterised protein [Raoultella terrigena]|uniref:Uncharacterized protein n=1 Tax=Raoultella terrigena TaxID=577 RepID=A0A4U9D545_RAOTE|nr:Uncharacterised protein [Raoultella terrigena]